jgi:hypothetical protein
MYNVIIVQDNETATLKCSSYNEALQVKQAFINYGKCESVTIEAFETMI